MADDIAHFHSIPWVSNLLSDPTFVTHPTPSRIFKSSTEDALFSTTLNTSTTIPACLLQYRPEPNTAPTSSTVLPTSEIRLFFTLGPDLNGYPGVLHGGIVATLLDECMGLTLSLRLGGGLPGMEGPVTAYLNTRFVAPVGTPGTVVVSARIAETKGERKWKIQGDICDGEGRVLAEAECLYILPRGAGGAGGSRL
ncbi:hypothetical protein BDW74DRAFT_173950 [Aspergillus multicolor]|uniref:PaaI family thioesterase n=1 Tax=Aspergillus multicolor TaxID=41759 RepID=UPI003CCDB00A